MDMKLMGRRALLVALTIPAILFVVMGLRWLVNPEGVAPELGLTIETGLGLSSQIGDLAAFFLVLGLTILIALVTNKRIWFYPPVMLLTITAVGRLVAWLVHGAAFAPQMIVSEIVVALLILAGARFLAESD